jgi:hypothetical protein
MILDRLTVPTSATSPEDTLASTSQRLQVEVRQTKKSPSHRKFRIALPRSFVDCVWEFGVRGTGNGWEFQLHPVNIRPRDAFVFKVIRSGRVSAVRALLESGALSMQDRAVASDFDPCESLLDVGCFHLADTYVLTLLQLAASYGHIELCKFLLEQHSYFCDDTTMHSALHRFIECSRYYRAGNDFRSARQRANDMYYLFMDRYGLVVQSSEEVDYKYNISFGENVESNLLLTERSLRHMLDGQLIASIRRSAFSIKFPAAMRSVGWPPDMFLEFLQPYDPTQLVTATDGKARTVLHWAAKHFGYWACAWNNRDSCPDDTMINSYATLLRKFILLGADVHAVTSQYETPLTTALHQIMAFTDWPACALAIKRWGETLVEAGIVLNRYIQVENALLRSLAGKSRAWESNIHYMLLPHMTQLLIVEGSILAAEIQFCRPIDVWECRTSPGAWDTESRLPTRSFLQPPRRGDHSLFWHEVEKVRIYSEPYLIQGTSRSAMPFYSLEDSEDNWTALFERTQDDHGLVARTILRDRSRSEAKIPLLRDRASSVPPELTRKRYNRLPTHSSPAREIILGNDRWIPVVYRCPIDSMKIWRPGTFTIDGCWSEDNPRFLPSFDSRSPEERLIAKDDWEIQLLREHGDEDTVKRFGHRFCRELRDLIEQELATTRSIMELV